MRSRERVLLVKWLLLSNPKRLSGLTPFGAMLNSKCNGRAGGGGGGALFFQALLAILLRFGLGQR